MRENRSLRVEWNEDVFKKPYFKAPISRESIAKKIATRYIADKEVAMEENKPKEGVSIKEVEAFAKKHRYPLFFSLLLFFSCIFGLVGKPGWSVLCVAAGALLGLLLPTSIEIHSQKIFGFVFRQDKVVMLLIGASTLLVAVFIPFLIFLLIGLLGGKALHQMTNGCCHK